MVVFAGNDVDLDLDDVVSHIEALLRRPPVLPVDLRGAYVLSLLSLPCLPCSPNVPRHVVLL